MAELNSKKEMQMASEKQIEKMKKEGIPPSPADKIRVEKLAQFKKESMTFLEQSYIDESLSEKDLLYFDLMLRAKQKAR